MGEVSYVSRVRIERLGGPQRLAYLPAEQEPVIFGVHSEVAEHYGVSPEQFPPHATTLDYVVAATGGWLAGTFAGALEARQIEVERERFEVEAVGEIETDDRVLVIKRITVHYRLAVSESQRADAERVHGLHAQFCPVARSLKGAIDVRTELELVWVAVSGRFLEIRDPTCPSPSVASSDLDRFPLSRNRASRRGDQRRPEALSPDAGYALGGPLRGAAIIRLEPPPRALLSLAG